MEGAAGEDIHPLFIRYGRGSYLGPVATVDVKKSLKYKASVEYCGAFGLAACSAGGDISAKGAIFATVDFRDKLKELMVEFKDKSKPKKNLFVAELDATLPADVLRQVYEAVPSGNVLLNLLGPEVKVKCKKKPPKPGKEKELEFTSGTIPLACIDIVKEEVFFDAGDFKQAKVENTFVIDELVIPDGLSPAEARLKAKRKGKMVRVVSVDGAEKKTEFELLV